jgi:hypothetical protein
LAQRLIDNINSAYIEAANKLTSKNAPHKIVAYVESYDDIFFWRTVLAPYENEKRYFEILLPSKGKQLERGKKAAISNILEHVGPDMIACVDADYDYLIQGASPTSRTVLLNPYVFHTYAYAIENLQCYAPSLHGVVVASILNDKRTFDYVEFLTQFSRIIWPLFVWNVWFYRSTHYGQFTITYFNQIIELGKVSATRDHSEIFSRLQQHVNRKIRQLETKYPDASKHLKSLADELHELGIHPDNTYMYIQGHHLFNHVVVPLLISICDRLYNERIRELKEQSQHIAQYHTELACYEKSTENIPSMLKKNTGYMMSPEFKKIQHDIEEYLNNNFSILPL